MASPEDTHQSLALPRESFVGPLPPPTVLAEYELLAPGVAKRLLEMAEQQSNHRLVLERDLLVNARRERRVGQIFALLLVLCAIGAAIYLATHGSEIAAAIIGSTGLLAQVVTFILYRPREDRESLDAQVDEWRLHE